MSKQNYEEKGSFKILSQIWIHTSKERKLQFYFFTLINILSSFSESFSIALTLPLISVLIDPSQVWEISTARDIFISLGINNSEEILAPITIIFIVATLISSSIRIFILRANNYFAAVIGNDLSCLAYSKTINQSYEDLIEQNSSELIAASTNFIDFTVTAIYSFLNLLCNISFIFTIELTLFLLNWKVALSSLIIFGSAYILISRNSKLFIERNGKIIAELIKRKVQTIKEGLGLIREVLLGNKQQIFINRYEKIDAIYRKKLAANKFITFMPKYIIESIGFVFIALLGYILSKDGNTAQYTLPILGTFALAAQKLLPAMQQCYNSVGTIRSSKGSIIEVLKMLNRRNQKKDITKIKPLSFRENLTLSNICFKYLSSKDFILRDIILTIKKGERIGIIGNTGSGKTTLTDILMGLLKPIKGNILIDNKKLYDNNYPENLINWRSIISHVPQNIYLSDSSFAENIAFGESLENIDLNKVEEAAKKAQIEKFICSTNFKYLTKVGDNGIKLSGGQKQRIGIARALYQDSQIIVFDEATSALDNKTESEVIDSLYSLDSNLTIIIIAHRLSTIKKCDRVIKLNDSKIVEIS